MLVDFNVAKIQLVLFDCCNNTGAVDVKMDGPVFEVKSSFKTLGWLSILNLIRALTLYLLLKLLPKKLEPWFVLWSFFLLRLLCISINLPHNHAWNTDVMSGLVLLSTPWNCQISYKNEYIYKTWSFTCCLSWTHSTSLKCSQLKSFL